MRVLGVERGHVLECLGVGVQAEVVLHVVAKRVQHLTLHLLAIGQPKKQHVSNKRKGKRPEMCGARDGLHGYCGASHSIP